MDLDLDYYYYEGASRKELLVLDWSSWLLS